MGEGEESEELREECKVEEWDGTATGRMGWCGANVTNKLSTVMTAAGRGVGCVGAGGSRLSYAIRMDAGTGFCAC